MFLPKHFQLTDRETIQEIMTHYSFATLISVCDGFPITTQIPFTVNKDMTYLYSHVAKANKQWQHIDHENVVVLFQGPHSYISPSWYETKDAVPTWNYITIEIHGQAQLVTDEEVIQKELQHLIDNYELPNSSYNLQNVDEAYLANLHKGIQAFQIRIIDIQAKAKLSQNHPLARQQLIIDELEKRGTEHDVAIANYMRKSINI